MHGVKNISIKSTFQQTTFMPSFAMGKTTPWWQSSKASGS